MPEITRRDFLVATTHALLWTSSLLGLDALFHFLDYETEPAAKTVFDLGPASSYPIGTRSLLPDIPAVLIHTENGVTALSLVCTHLGCTVQQKTDGFECPCHGSLYDQSGNVLRGPALRALRVLRVEQSADGQLILHTD